MRRSFKILKLDKLKHISHCTLEDEKKGLSACTIIRWGYIVVFIALVSAIAGLAAYLYYLKAKL